MLYIKFGRSTNDFRLVSHWTATVSDKLQEASVQNVSKHLQGFSNFSRELLAFMLVLQKFEHVQIKLSIKFSLKIATEGLWVSETYIEAFSF